VSFFLISDAFAEMGL